MLKHLDEEILELMEEDSLADEIEQADSFKEGVYAALVKIGKHYESKSKTPPLAPPIMTPEREILVSTTE